MHEEILSIKSLIFYLRIKYVNPFYSIRIFLISKIFILVKEQNCKQIKISLWTVNNFYGIIICYNMNI